MANERILFMKKLIENFIIIMVLTIAILFSYALIEKKISGRSSSEFINFLFSTQEKASSNKSSVTSNKGNSKKEIIHPRSRQIL